VGQQFQLVFFVLHEYEPETQEILFIDLVPAIKTIPKYRNDRLYNSLFLSPSLCTKRSILFGRGNLTQAVYKQSQAKIWRPRS